MRKNDVFTLSAGDLANHLACRHLTALDMAVAKGDLAPPAWRDPMLAVLQERGLLFEREYLDTLKSQGLRISEPGIEDSSSADRTVTAMQEGADIIYQAPLRNGPWIGRADFLKRVDTPSNLGPWSYEVIDAKLARETRAGTILQICLYSQMVGAIQGLMPLHMHVITPEETFKSHQYRVQDFLSYHRLIQRRLEKVISQADNILDTYPEPVPHCDICRWWQRCDTRRRDDDHLSLVAGISKIQRNEIGSWGVHKLEGLAQVPLPLERKPVRGAVETYERVREQARVQLESRVEGAPVYELLPVSEGTGFCSLPEPSAGDIFFDIESDPFVGMCGLEYLLGWTWGSNDQPEYYGEWAFTATGEKDSFEAFMDTVKERWQNFPDLHIYHFTPYEPAALKRLMGRYATREIELDRMLRAGLFVDLYAVAKQALRAGIERYSLKELEVFHGFVRALPLHQARHHLHAFERIVERGNLHAIPDETLAAIQAYNRDDCLSTMKLRNWLEGLRSKLANTGQSIPRPQLQPGDASEAVKGQQQLIQELYDKLAGDLSPDADERNAEQQARWLLANMLDWYRRESKAVWWEYFRLRDLEKDLLIEEKAALSGLQFFKRVDTVKKSVIDRYRFPAQECELRKGDSLCDEEENRFTVEAIDAVNCTIDIKKGPKFIDHNPVALIRNSMVPDQVKSAAIIRFATWIASNGIDSPGPFRAGRDLLSGLSPRPGYAYTPEDDPQKVAIKWGLLLDQGILPIQGPPGSGKSHTAAHMIVALVRAGKKVGITALGHKVIRLLLNKVVEIARAEQLNLQCIQKVGDLSGEPDPSIHEVEDNAPVLSALQSNQANIAAGTPWLWARPEFAEAVDVLFVDEAGQLSLTDALAVSQAAKNIVLLGDPQQLKQPQQGSHPEGTGVSALEHILKGRQTITSTCGIFLSETWRLHPNICSFISEMFYEGRLRSRPTLDRQVLDGNTPFAGAGLWYVPVPHDGNQSSSPEEVERVAGLVNNLTKGDVYWTDNKNNRRPLTLRDIMIIAPYNAQVVCLTSHLPSGAFVGTVDKFQGQEAPVVIFSLSTSSPEDAPRGMEFLYSLNRLNVAVSRARTACILVANPRLFEPECKTPEQMRLANAFCRFIELAG
ncbi:MAG: TM0106 family RecB-like putative nuclease [Chitinophagaceae bacterium]